MLMNRYVSEAFLLGVLVVSVGGFAPPQRSRWTTTGSTVAPSSRWLLNQQDDPIRQHSTLHEKSRRASRVSLQAASSSSTSSSYDYNCDVLVLGSGPAGRSIASLLSSKNINVILSDQNKDNEWPPNYGVWRDEWDAVLQRYSTKNSITLEGGKCGDCLDRQWDITDCFFGGSFGIPMEERLRLERPYCRVDRFALRKALSPSSGRNYQELSANHISNALNPNIYSPSGSLVHDERGSTIQLQQADGTMLSVRTQLIVDTTGHETKLVLRDTRADGHRPPGFQIAYGCLVELDESSTLTDRMAGPYDKEAMTLFDYRTDHFETADDLSAVKAPTFMYVMPLEGNKVFFEETSLVARPAISFQECKERCFKRIKHLGLKVKEVEEEEFCYIPMGGALPIADQRVIGLGGSAAMVHPSTGYHLCRMLMGASDMANAIEQELSREEPDLDRAAASAYHAIWSPGNIRQRNFAVFGGEFLMEQDVVGLRGFFDGFFALPLEMWAGFLAGWPGLPNNDKHETWAARMWYGLNFIVRIPAPVALSMAWSIISYSVQEGIPLMQSVTPFFGEPKSYEHEKRNANVGDVAAKEEARRMITEAKLMDIPVAFDGDKTESESLTATPKATVAAPKPEIATDEIATETPFQ